MKAFISTAALCTILATGASAATTNFVVDYSASELKVTNVADGIVCDITNCGVKATWAVPGIFTAETGVPVNFDLITWTGKKTGATVFNVTANLAFSSPEGSISGTGTGGALLLSGFIKGGILRWNEVVTNFQGYDIDALFAGGAGIFLGKSVTTGATLTVNTDQTPAPVPLPAASPLLIAGISAIGGLRALRRKK